MSWRSNPFSAQQVGDIWFIGSAEGAIDGHEPFMSSWTLNDFITFKNSVISDQNALPGTSPVSIFVDQSGNRIDLKDRFGLYAMKFICENWQLAVYPGSHKTQLGGESVAGSPGWYLGWIGYYFGTYFPWNFSETIGWFYLHQESTAGGPRWLYTLDND